jgi:hypothetical protein
MEVNGQLHATADLTWGKMSQYPLHERLGGPQIRSKRCGVKKIHLPPSGIEPQFLGRPPHSVVTTLTELSRLLKLSLNRR